jgi:outer membrane lipoprotein carrier protein
MRVWIVLTVALLVTLPVHASARRALDEFARGLQSFEARFEQAQFDDHGSEPKVSSGELALKRPNQFRFDYLTPYRQRVIADGNRIWTYDEDLEQVSVRPQGGEMQSNPLTVLLDLKELDQRYAVEELAAEEGRKRLELKPKGDSDSFERVELRFNGSQLDGMVLHDAFGQRTEIRFVNARRNQRVAADRFRFTPPEGVDVIGEVAPDAEITPLND